MGYSPQECKEFGHDGATNTFTFSLLWPLCVKPFAAPPCIYDNSVFLSKYWKTYSDKHGQ